MSSYSEALKEALKSAEIKHRKNFEKERDGIEIHNNETLKNMSFLEDYSATWKNI